MSQELDLIVDCIIQLHISLIVKLHFTHSIHKYGAINLLQLKLIKVLINQTGCVVHVKLC